MLYPDLESAKKLAENHTIIPISLEICTDMDTPISIFKRMETKEFCFLLESVEGNKNMTRYSFIGRNPFLTFKSYGNESTLSYIDGRKTKVIGNPIEELQKLCKSFKSPILPNIPQFSSGAVGYFAYDIIRLTEFLPYPPKDDLKQPDMHFMFMDEIIIFDHINNKLILIVNMHSDRPLELEYERVTKRLSDIQDQIANNAVQPKNTLLKNISAVKPQSNMSKDQFCKMVEKAKEYIKNGDIFQVVLSQRFSIDTNVDPFNAFRAIRRINPSPYMYYLKFDDYQIAGASPEMLVRVENGIVQTSPIAGTKPRGKNSNEDKLLEIELIADPKENAEHTMLVDLGRNDIGKICRFGSVYVSRLKYIQKFSHVMHMTSDVKGEISPKYNIFDALCAVLPAGTLSGAPKVRAMEIIDELETVKRGFYGGAIGYISFSGSLDTCITIRTALFKDKKAYVQAGGGIVYDSIPENEYQESVNKAASMIKAIESAGELI